MHKHIFLKNAIYYNGRYFVQPWQESNARSGHRADWRPAGAAAGRADGRHGSDAAQTNMGRDRWLPSTRPDCPSHVSQVNEHDGRIEQEGCTE